MPLSQKEIRTDRTDFPTIAREIADALERVKQNREARDTQDDRDIQLAYSNSLVSSDSKIDIWRLHREGLTQDQILALANLLEIRRANDIAERQLQVAQQQQKTAETIALAQLKQEKELQTQARCDQIRLLPFEQQILSWRREDLLTPNDNYPKVNPENLFSLTRAAKVEKKPESLERLKSLCNYLETVVGLIYFDFKNNDSNGAVITRILFTAITQDSELQDALISTAKEAVSPWRNEKISAAQWAYLDVVNHLFR